MNKTIFVVDDNDTNLAMAKQALGNTYRVLLMPSAAKMFNLAEKITPDLILLDVEMPEMDGYEALAKLKADARFQGTPVMFLTAKTDPEAEVRGFELGAVDYVTKPFSPLVLLKHIEMHLNLDGVVKERTKRIITLQNGIVSVIANLVESRDKDTGGHIERTQRNLEILIKAMLEAGCYSDEIRLWNLDNLIPSAQLHDVGKIIVSDLILNKPGRLTKEEFDIMKSHVAAGENIIDEIMRKTGDDGFLRHAKLFASSHHEKWDGSGYLKGLSGEDIPLEGRIMAISDVYDALVSERVYKKPLSHREAVEIIKNDSGTHFDPKIVDIFLAIADDFLAEGNKP
jgi:putative two-component system response regulator